MSAFDTASLNTIKLFSSQGLALSRTESGSYGNLAALMHAAQFSALLLDFRHLSNDQSINATPKLVRDANLSSSINFYKVLGTILEPITNTLLSPGGDGYTDAVGNDTFFALAQASSDGLSHFASMGNGTIGLEDLSGLGDKDFGDIVISLKDPTLNVLT